MSKTTYFTKNRELPTVPSWTLGYTREYLGYYIFPYADLDYFDQANLIAIGVEIRRGLRSLDQIDRFVKETEEEIRQVNSVQSRKTVILCEWLDRFGETFSDFDIAVKRVSEKLLPEYVEKKKLELIKELKKEVRKAYFGTKTENFAKIGFDLVPSMDLRSILKEALSSLEGQRRNLHNSQRFHNMIRNCERTNEAYYSQYDPIQKRCILPGYLYHTQVEIKPVPLEFRRKNVPILSRTTEQLLNPAFSSFPNEKDE